MRRIISYFAIGSLFGFGLAMSGMNNPEKIIGFLNIFRDWDQDLLFVMGGAVITTSIGYFFVFKLKQPLLNSTFDKPKQTQLDLRLVSGASLFGIGWGLYGYCPGPAIAALAYLNVDTLLFIIAMIAGMFIGHKLISLFSSA